MFVSDLFVSFREVREARHRKGERLESNRRQEDENKKEIRSDQPQKTYLCGLCSVPSFDRKSHIPSVA
jgi:hypothetical protein